MEPPFIKVNEKFQLSTFITSTATATAGMMCLILVEPPVNFCPSSQRFKTHGGFFSPTESSHWATATQIFTLCPVSLSFSDTLLAWKWARMRISVRVCILCSRCCVWGRISGRFNSFWWIMAKRGPRNQALWTSSVFTVALGSLVIMAVLPHSCLFGAGPNKKRWVCGERSAEL